MATIIDVNGEEREVKPKNGSDFKLDELYKLLGCTIIEIVATNDDRIMVVNGDPIDVKEFIVNKKATELYWFGDETPLAGKVLVCERDQVL